MIKVFDKNGNELEPTYPKRARGLVKKGRARFINDSAIVLVETQSNKTEAYPPIDIQIDIQQIAVQSEDMKMFDNNEEKFNSINAYFGEIQITNTRAKSVCGSLTGTVIGAGASKNAYLAPFDGTYNSENLLDPNRGEAVERWFGLKMDEPAAVTSIMVGTSKRKKHRIFGSLFQGSNDGVLWTTLAEFTEEDYLAYSNTDKFYYRKDIPNAVPYVYYRYFNVDDKGGNGLMSLLLFGGGEISTLDTFRGEITYTGVRSVSMCGSLVGEIIGAGGEKSDYLGAFDGRTVTRTEFGINLGEAVNCWFGIKADEPTRLSKITLCAPMSQNRWYRRSHVIIDSYFQGSVDGVNWVTLCHFTEEDYIAYHGKSTYYSGNITDEGAYTYFRWFNYDDGGVNALSELYLYPAEAKISTADTYYGEISCTGVRSVSLYGSLSGEVIGAGADSKFAYLGAFDGSIATQTNLGINMGDTVYNWFGVKMDEPAAVCGVTVATLNGEKRHYIYGSLFQGSNDGVNWTTLAEFGESDYITYSNSGMRYYTKEITDTASYTYFRYFNQNDDGGNCLAQLLLFTAETISGIRCLESMGQSVAEAAPAAIPAVNTSPDDELDIVKKYVESQMSAVNASMLDSRKNLFNLLVDGEITAAKYEEMLRVVEENGDRRILQLQKMLHDAVRKSDQRVLDLNQSLKAYIKEQVDGVKKGFEDRLSALDDLEGRIDDAECAAEDVRCDLESMIEDLKSEVFDRLDEMED